MTIKALPDEHGLMNSLGLSAEANALKNNIAEGDENQGPDLSELRGMAGKADQTDFILMGNRDTDEDLNNLAELVPDLKTRRLDVVEGDTGNGQEEHAVERKLSMYPRPDNETGALVSDSENNNEEQNRNDAGSLRAIESRDGFPETNNVTGAEHAYDADYQAAVGGLESSSQADLTDYPDSNDDGDEPPAKVPKEFLNMSSAQSISTATQTHEMRMPMYLPTFKPATGCTNASDFIVRCFCARLRSGITVVKHGRSRWCKSRLRVLHLHPDGCSLSWKPAEGEPNSAKRPPKLGLSTCQEVRHAWSPDPQNPMYTGTPILRQKCEAANAHKSFALIFKHRTVDITAVTADQCKVLMEGFSALCFRLQVATLASRSGKKGQAMPEEDGVSTTASATLTNSSTPRGR